MVEYNLTYLVHPGDTLQRISKKLGLSSIDIMAYHNSNCGKHEKISGGQPICIEEILISPDFLITADETVQSLLIKKSKKKVSLSAGFKLALKPDKYLREYGVLITIEKGDKVNTIKYENSVQCVELTKEHFIFEINRVGKTYINDEEVNDIADELAVKTASVLYPLNILVDNKGIFLSVANHQHIKNRWLTIKENILKSHEGETVEEYLTQTEEAINNEHALNTSLKKDYFLRAFFNGIYTSYTALLSFEDDVLFPLLKNISEPKYNVKHKIKKQLDEYELVCLEQKGILDDERCVADFENGSPVPYFSLMQPDAPKAKGSYSAKYFLNPDTHIIESMHLECDIQLSKNKKVEVTICHLANTENAENN